MSYVFERGYCPKIFSEGRFLRRLKAIPREVWAILLCSLAKSSGAYNAGEYVIDSFPLPVCHNIRISRCRILHGPEYRGYNASKKQFFYGLKIHAIVSTSGIPIYFECSSGSALDLTAFKNMNMEFIEESTLYGNAAYNDYELKDQLKTHGLWLLVDRKSNSKRPHPPGVARQISHKRKVVETGFSWILQLFARTLYAVRPSGLLLKLTLFFRAFTSTFIT